MLIAQPSLPTSSRLRPLVEVVDRAEVVSDPVATAVADQEHVDVAKLGLAVGAMARTGIAWSLTVGLTGLPVGAADRPGDHVLEPAEHRPALARRLVGAKTVVCLNRRPTPGAAFVHQAIG